MADEQGKVLGDVESEKDGGSTKYIRKDRHKTINCKVCFKTMRSDNLKRHMERHTDLIITDEEEVANGVYMCSACPEQFRSENLLDQHRSSIHDIQETLQEERNIYMDKVTKAPLIEITRTVLKNMGKQNYKCTICILPFSSKETLRRHEKAVHSRVKSMKCLFCAKSFHLLKNRRLHMENTCIKNPECRFNIANANTTNQIGMGKDTETTSKDIDIDVSDGDLVKYQSMWNGALRSFRMTFDPSPINMIPRFETRALRTN